MSRREFLQQAQTYKPDKHNISGFYISEKLDGQRCFWDGGISRGLPTESIPWANTINPKTGERKAKIKPIATGLWSRYGNPVIAPDWWLNELPQIFLDGELFAGRGNFQTLRSIVSRDVPDDRWRQVEFAVYGTPPTTKLFQQGEIKNSNFHSTISPDLIAGFIAKRQYAGVALAENIQCGTFTEELSFLNSALPCEGVVHAHRHELLSPDRKQAEATMTRWMDRVMDLGGEGLVMRKPDSIWTPKRVHECVKMKPFKDDCGIVTGFTSGSLTDKGSKARGMIGALILDYNGMRLELSGMNYGDERAFDDANGTDGAFESYAWEHPGVDMPAGCQGKTFKVGDKVEFRYRELSDEGLPKEARYYRGV